MGTLRMSLQITNPVNQQGIGRDIMNVTNMNPLGLLQVHCPCPYNVLTMSRVRKLGFVPSECRSNQISNSHETKVLQPNGD